MSKSIVFILFTCSCLFAWGLDSRQDFVYLLAVFIVAFAAYYFLAFKSLDKLTNPWFWAIAVRLPFLFAVPYLSDDFYRFIWDGMSQWQGINPYLYTPIEGIKEFDHLDTLEIFDRLNSQSYYSVYPAFNQYFFAIAAKFGGDSLVGQVIALRLVIVTGDILVLFLLKKVGRLFNKQNLFLLYAFNPLVILEFTGNLHFEVWVIAFVLAAFYVSQVYSHKIGLSAVLFGLAISTKLLPALFLPLIWRYLGFKKGFIFCATAMLTFGLSFTPYLDVAIVQNMAKSIDLFFRSFEFNASLYYLLRGLGLQVVGYNWIGTIGPVLKALTLVLVLFITLKGKSFSKSALLIYLVYLLLATTVHPWYILPVFVLSFFSEVKSILVWTALVFLSYHAYGFGEFHESLWVVGLEYLVLFGFLWKERLEIFLFQKL